MSPVKNLGVLAFASAVLAVPHSNNHRHLHVRGGPGAYSDPSSAAAPAYGESSSSAAPVNSGAPYYGSGNDTSPYGTGYGSGYAAPTGSYSLSYLPCPTSTCSVYTTTYFWRGSSSVATLTGGSTAAPASVPATYSPASVPVSSPVASDGCAPDTTITTKVTETVTVTAGAVASTSAAPAPTYGSGDGSSAAAASSWADPSSAAAAPSYGGDGKWASNGGWGGYTKSYEAPSSAAPVSSAAPTYSAGSTTDPAPGSYGSSSASAAAPSYSAPSSGGGSGATPFSGKRGVAYNDASLAEPFLASSDFGWGYNWDSDSNGLSSKLSYIPELHTADDVDKWAANAKAAIDSGSKYLFFINEPDMASQGSMDAATAAKLWRDNMEPFKDQATLVAPAVSSSNSAGQGLDWLQGFMDACSDCHIGAINLHWYDADSNDVQGFKDHISQGTSQFGLPAFVGEFGFIGSDSDISSALDDTMGWLDSNDDVLGYAYFWVTEGLLVDGTTPSSYGLTYLGSS